MGGKTEGDKARSEADRESKTVLGRYNGRRLIPMNNDSV